MRKSLFTTMLFFASLYKLAAQNTTNTEAVMASEGKIYVVMAVCLVILLGLLAYVASIDKKISKKEANH